MTELAERFKEHLFQAPGIVDPEGVHHVFAADGHGQKVDFDAIPDGVFLFEEWADVNAEAVDLRYPAQEVGTIILLSVAGGTNRLVEPVAQRLQNMGRDVKHALTRKKEGANKEVELEPEARELIIADDPDLILALEDVGTTGSTSSTAILSARKAGAKRVEAMNTLQRRERLEKLIAIGAIYSSIIYHPMPTYTTREECEATGFCAQGWTLIPKGQ